VVDRSGRCDHSSTQRHPNTIQLTGDTNPLKNATLRPKLISDCYLRFVMLRKHQLIAELIASILGSGAITFMTVHKHTMKVAHETLLATLITISGKN